MNQIEYESLINPKRLFKNRQEFLDFINIDCTKEDLQSMLSVLEEEEMYEECQIIFDKMKLF